MKEELAVPGCYVVFHMNLAFSAIAEAERLTVIKNCYFPLLDTVEATGLPIGIECSGWTLQQVAALAPAWLSRFRALLAKGRCELVGSGYVQLIGPLVPHIVNRKNQELGLAVYEQLLGCRPRLAMVNEMAFSKGLVAVYGEVGYDGLLMERENLCLASGLPLEGEGPWLVEGSPQLLLSDSILFQKFQRLIHRQIPRKAYLDFVERRVQTSRRPLSIYCSDAEIFDFRPKRYAYEENKGSGDEWSRISDLLSDLNVRFVSPSDALAQTQNGADPTPIHLTSARYPVPVKKQPKYNLSRWAVSGSDDLELNTFCHRLLRKVVSGNQPQDWPGLLALWASDLRTHIHPDRFSAARNQITTILGRDQHQAPDDFQEGPPPESSGINLVQDPDGFSLRLKTRFLKLVLNRRRGLTVTRLAFSSHDFVPLVGTLEHGYFDLINLGADFYTGGVVIESPAKALRITDLERVEPQFGWVNGWFGLRCQFDTVFGPLVKTLYLHGEKACLRMAYSFPGWERPPAIIRVGNVTLKPEAFSSDLRLRCHNGGAEAEEFKLDTPCRHQAAVSSLISCSAGFGATTGRIEIGDGHRGLALTWDPAFCAAFPMLWHEPGSPGDLTRVLFSLAELDDTRRSGGSLPAFQVDLTPLSG